MCFNILTLQQDFHIVFYMSCNKFGEIRLLEYQNTDCIAFFVIKM